MAVRTRGVRRRARARVSMACVVGVALATVGVMSGWSAPGHRTITAVAIGLLPEACPAWVRDPIGVARASYESNEPDRWRGTRLDAMEHENDADHYMDLELLAARGLTLETLPRLRYAFVEAVVRATPAEEGAYDPEGIGLLPYAIAEHYAKVQSSFNSVRILERLGEPARAMQLETARANALYHMGQLSHFVADAAQPLHLTIHHHGWVGENPSGYTTDRGFHSDIDYGVVARHGLGPRGLAPYVVPMAAIPSDGVWEATIALMARSFAQVEPLYALQKSGELDREAGRAFIGARMADGASVLAGLYLRAWEDSAPTEKQVADWVRYNSFGEEFGYEGP